MKGFRGAEFKQDRRSDRQHISARGARTSPHPVIRPHHPKRRLSKRVLFGLVTLAIIAFICSLAPLIAADLPTSSATTINLGQVNLKPLTDGHIFGTDYMGRDVLKEAIWGGRASLFVGLTAAFLAVSFGTVWGSLSAFIGGLIDTVMMRIVDGLLSIPSIILLLAFNSLISTPSMLTAFPQPLLDLLGVTSYSLGLLPLLTVIVVISATSWLEAARIARTKIVGIISEEYVTAATALGAGTTRMLFRHLIPNAMTVLLVEATLLISDAVLMESGLSFLGLGLGPGTPSWGSMLSQAQLSLLQGNWWAVLIPGLLITATIASVNLISEGWLDLLGSKAPAA